MSERATLRVRVEYQAGEPLPDPLQLTVGDELEVTLLVPPAYGWTPTWSTAQTVAGPMSMSQIANTTQGTMVGDHISAVGGKSVALFAVGKTPANGQAFDEALFTVAGGLALNAGTNPATGPIRYTGTAAALTLPPQR